MRTLFPFFPSHEWTYVRWQQEPPKLQHYPIKETGCRELLHAHALREAAWRTTHSQWRHGWSLRRLERDWTRHLCLPQTSKFRGFGYVLSVRQRQTSQVHPRWSCAMSAGVPWPKWRSEPTLKSPVTASLYSLCKLPVSPDHGPLEESFPCFSCLASTLRRSAQPIQIFTARASSWTTSQPPRAEIEIYGGFWQLSCFFLSDSTCAWRWT